MGLLKSFDDCLQSTVFVKFILIVHICQLCPSVIVSLACTDVAIILAYAQTLSFSEPSHLACKPPHGDPSAMYPCNTRTKNLRKNIIRASTWFKQSNRFHPLVSLANM
ncbi:hypothetical protein AN901_200940 [Pseudomonas syringae pv. theae]|nr:hypothetical protein AN901_200940 [Pseudomonas syringae pv. theae]